jgi:hypothetical protein
MRRISAIALAVGGLIGLAATEVVADWVELANNDLINGEIISLDHENLKLKSANFGEMTIPRGKVSLIGLGERPVPTAAKGADERNLSPLAGMENAQINQLLQQAFGPAGIGEMQQQMSKTKDGLKALRRDLGATPEAEALDSYIRLFDLLGNLAPRNSPPSRRPGPSRPAATPQQEQRSPAAEQPPAVPPSPAKPNTDK